MGGPGSGRKPGGGKGHSRQKLISRPHTVVSTTQKKGNLGTPKMHVKGWGRNILKNKRK